MHRRVAFITIAGVFTLVMRLWGTDFSITLCNYIGLATLVSFGLVLLTGIAGITSFGQAAFAGIGAYATGYLSTRWGFSPWFGLIAAVTLAFASSWIIGALTLRLSGHYLPLSTLAWGTALFYLFGNQEELGGHTGLDGIPPLRIGSFALTDNRDLFLLIVLLVIASGAFLSNLLNSRVGRAMRTLKEAGVMAEAFGIDTARQKRLTFIIAAVMAAMSGWLYAHMMRFVNPTPFSLTAGIEYLFMAVLGGAGYIWGAALGAAVITISNIFLQEWVPAVLGTSRNYETIVFGCVLIWVLQRAPNGLMGTLSGRFKRGTLDSARTSRASSLRGGFKPQESKLILELKRVGKSFGGLVALNNVSFDLERGEILALVGPNGAGKTTLFNVITGITSDATGEIDFAGFPTIGRQPHEIGQLGISRTFQHVILLKDRTVLENVMVGAYRRGEAGVFSSLFGFNSQEEEAVRAESIRQIRAVGLEAFTFSEAGSLALGQQRIVEIARALCSDPALLLLDEPAAGLRHHEKTALADVLRQLRNGGLTILLVEHDMGFVMNLVDRVVVLDFGQVIARGSPSEIQKDSTVINAYLGGID